MVSGNLLYVVFIATSRESQVGYLRAAYYPVANNVPVGFFSNDTSNIKQQRIATELHLVRVEAMLWIHNPRVNSAHQTPLHWSARNKSYHSVQHILTLSSEGKSLDINLAAQVPTPVLNNPAVFVMLFSPTCHESETIKKLYRIMQRRRASVRSAPRSGGNGFPVLNNIHGPDILLHSLFVNKTAFKYLRTNFVHYLLTIALR